MPLNLDLLALAASQGGARINEKDAGKRGEIAALARAGGVACVATTRTYSQWVATDEGMARLAARPARPVGIDGLDAIALLALLAACFLAVAP